MKGQEIHVRNPRTGQTDFSIRCWEKQALESECERLRQGQRKWATLAPTERANALRSWAKLLRDTYYLPLLSALTTDTGRVNESKLEIDGVCITIERWAEWICASPLTVNSYESATKNTVRYMQSARPYPLVGVLSPWNFPLLLSLLDAIPALATGCAVIVKPSEVTPRFIEVLQASICKIESLAKVISIVVGNAETGIHLVDLVDTVCFTGSVEVGKKVLAQGGNRLVPIHLELGGKDPAIITATANIPRATEAILWGATANSGQSCLSIERIYVDAKISEVFLQKLAQRAKSLELNFPDIQKGQIGPVISARQADLIQRHLDDAKRQGATIHCGGEIQNLGGGFWCPPTVLSNVHEKMLCMKEETFGPLMPVQTFDHEDEAIDLANASIYGLSAAVFANTEQNAIEIANRLEVGAVSINDACLTAFYHVGNKDAWKSSGFGVSRMGDQGIQRFRQRRCFISGNSDSHQPWWYKN